jgi:hypothetical protein
MTLQQNIINNLYVATTGRDIPTRELLKVVVAEMARGKNKEISDEEAVRIIRKFKANAIECGNLDELPILEVYLPKMLSEASIRAIMNTIIFEYTYTGIPNMGKIMQYVNAHRQADQIDKKIASSIAKEMITANFQ